MRVSDTERDEVLNALGDHAAVGRLTLDELEDRSSQVLAAKTRGELAAVTRDLPGETSLAVGTGLPATAAPAPSRAPVHWMVSILGGNHRRGRFRAAREVNAVNILGNDEIDLREAEIEGGELTFNMVSVLGGSNIYVPDTVEVDIGGVNILGGNQEHGTIRPPRRGAPLIRVRTINFLGSVNIYHLPPEARGLPLARARRLAKQAERGELPTSTSTSTLE
jgi:hypothetical protein